MSRHDVPIRRKLMTIILLTSGIVLALTCSVFFAYEYLAFRRNAQSGLETLAKIIATNSTAALAFENPDDAEEILSALQAEKQIVAAALYDGSGALFTFYPRTLSRADFPEGIGQDGYGFAGAVLAGFQPVIAGSDRRLGTLYLRSDMSELYARFRLYSAMVALVICVSLLLAYLISRRLQRQISQPILALAETARAVSDRRDYSVRAGATDGQELRALTDAFNHMLTEIQSQNTALQKAYDDLRESQTMALQQERLTALGQMASGIAHDINNALSPVSLYTESLLEAEPDLSPRARDYLNTIHGAIQDVANTVSRLREFSRPREAQLPFIPVAINELVVQVIKLTAARWRDQPQQRGIAIALRSELDDSLPVLMGAPTEIRDALTNLIFNAVDAMPAGGELTVRTRRMISPEQANASQPQSSRVIVEVTDTGSGMEEEIRQRCLEPFFTTKGERGTGLGLAMVYGMAQRHGATLEIDSEIGKGTTMRLVMPGTGPADLIVQAAPPVQVAKAQRILLVDDDPLVGEALELILSNDGHRVTTAGDGASALPLFTGAKESGEPFSLVITDLGMPHMDGRKLACALKAESPDTPIILLTGWGQRLLEDDELPPFVDRVLGKPPRLQDLRAAVEELGKCSS